MDRNHKSILAAAGCSVVAGAYLTAWGASLSGWWGAPTQFLGGVVVFCAFACALGALLGAGKD